MTPDARTAALRTLMAQPEWAAVEQLFLDLDAQAVDALRTSIDPAANVYLKALTDVRRAFAQHLAFARRSSDD